MIFDLIIAEHCCVCSRVESQLKKFLQDKGSIKLRINNFDESPFKNVSIVPALVIDGKLFSYGEIDFNKLEQRV